MDKDRVALVTGGASGIGAAVAEKLSRDHYHVVIADRAVPDETFVRNYKRVDVRREDAVATAVAETYNEFGRIDALVNCAGIGVASPMVETTLASWNEVISVNLTGTFLFCREVAKYMMRAKGGAIVNVASIDAHAADPNYGSYNASKAGILGLTRTLAIELATLNIRVNSVSPGLVLTPMITGGSASNPAVRQHIDGDFKRVPMRRILRPSEVAAVCAFLLSPDASGITGSDHVVDGGLLADAYLVNSYPA